MKNLTTSDENKLEIFTKIVIFEKLENLDFSHKF